VAEPKSPRHRAFGEALRAFRTERSLSQEALAAAADLDRTYVSGIERGESNPSLTNLFKLADALGIPLSELAARAEQKPKRGRR
jgi:transcriptional regulator with XRE-family HTH domain